MSIAAAIAEIRAMHDDAARVSGFTHAELLRALDELPKHPRAITRLSPEVRKVVEGVLERHGVEMGSGRRSA